jgi:hypothetical protein
MYDNYLKCKWDNQSVPEYAVSTARAKARQEEVFIIAKKMKDHKLSIDIVVNVTGLTEQEIEKL